MMLDDEQLTLIQRGIDAAIDRIISMAQNSIVMIAKNHGVEVAGPLTGFVQAINENRLSLASIAQDDATKAHIMALPDDELEEANAK